MAYRMSECFLLLIFAVTFSQAQDFQFPGETERPSRFPINPQETTPSTQGTTGNGFVENTTPSAAYNQCYNDCPVTGEYNPVCGTDNVVYSNPGRLGCAKRCGKQVELVRYGQCEDPTATTPTTTTTTTAAYTQCFNSCLSTSEYNPICGTDGIVYTNPGRLTCAQSCGKQVQEARRGQCTSGSRVS